MKNIVTDNFFDRVLDILKNARKQAKNGIEYFNGSVSGHFDLFRL